MNVDPDRRPSGLRGILWQTALLCAIYCCLWVGWPMGLYTLYLWGPVSLLAALLVCSAASNWGFLRSALLAATVWVVAIPTGTIWLCGDEFEGGLQSLSILYFTGQGSLIFGIVTGITLGILHRKVL